MPFDLLKQFGQMNEIPSSPKFKIGVSPHVHFIITISLTSRHPNLFPHHGQKRTNCLR